MEESKISSRLSSGIRFWFTYKLCVNYSYFGCFFFLVLALNVYSILSIGPNPYWVKSFFLLYDIAQIIIEFIAMILLSAFVKRYAVKWLYLCYTGCLFIFLFLQFIEAALVKSWDLSLSEGFQVAFGADMKNFLELLRLSELGMGVWYGILITAIIFPFFGVLLYKKTEKISAKKPVALHLNALVGALCIIPLLLYVIDGSVSGSLSHAEYSAYKKALPWKSTFLKVPTITTPLQAPLKSPRNDPAILSALALHQPQASKKPNVYLFVVESLRKDYLTEETAPYLMGFKKAHIEPKITISNANHTITSWFSIFHSAYPFYWSYHKNKTFEQGSLPLNILKNLGYKIHVYSSAQLKYYDFDQTMLGKGCVLADTLKHIPHHGDFSSGDSDAEVIKSFQRDISQHSKEGNVYIFFLDSTHFNYSWSKDFAHPFTPAEAVTWKDRLFNEEKLLEVLKNRYKNSISFIDHLFASAMQTLKKHKLYDESIVVFCGDHGEEFKEEGKLFHASHLSSMQINIPLFYKFGKKKKEVALSSHIDIFPSIINYISPDKNLLSHLDGHSIFESNRPSFAVVARYNSCAHPYEFLIHNGTDSLLARFDNKHNIFEAIKLQVLGSYQEGSSVTLSQQEIRLRFKEPLNELFPLKTYPMLH